MPEVERDLIIGRGTYSHRRSRWCRRCSPEEYRAAVLGKRQGSLVVDDEALSETGRGDRHRFERGRQFRVPHIQFEFRPPGLRVVAVGNKSQFTLRVVPGQLLVLALAGQQTTRFTAGRRDHKCAIAFLIVRRHAIGERFSVLAQRILGHVGKRAFCLVGQFPQHERGAEILVRTSRLPEVSDIAVGSLRQREVLDGCDADGRGTRESHHHQIALGHVLGLPLLFLGPVQFRLFRIRDEHQCRRILREHDPDPLRTRWFIGTGIRWNRGRQLSSILSPLFSGLQIAHHHCSIAFLGK